MTRKPVKDAPRWLRQRQRQDGTWRIWWEPSTAARKAGFAVVEFDSRYPVKADREAARLNREVDEVLASGGRRVAQRGAVTVDQVIAQFVRSPRFTRNLAPASQASYRRQFKLIADKWGPVPIRDFTKATINTWYETLFHRGTVRQAQALCRAFSVLFAYAEKMDARPENSNPCLRLGTVTPDPRQRHATWEEFDALMASATACGLPSVGLAIALSMLQGQRTTDVLAARRGDFRCDQVRWPGEDEARDVWIWDLTRSKTGAAGTLPLHDEASRLVAARLAQPGPDDGALILEERVGRPYDQDLFSKRWAEVRRHAAKACPSVATLQFRDLRRTFGALARIGGASGDDTGDVLGNSAAVNPRLRATYMPPQFFTAGRAVAAVQRPKDNEGRKAG